MAVEKSMASVKPSAPRKPPAVPPTKGESGQPHVGYGDLRTLSIKNAAKSEFSDHFTGHDGSAKHAGKEESNEGPKKGEKDGKPGYK